MTLAGMMPFGDRFSDLAARATRVAILPQPTGGLPDSVGQAPQHVVLRRSAPTLRLAFGELPPEVAAKLA